MRSLISALPRLPQLLFVAAFALAPLAYAPWHAAHAQSADEAEAEQDAMDAQKKAEARKAARRAAPPSALPGADSDSSDPSHARVDLNPTGALFDAVNKGSLMAAKEALNRGADMNARNVLDQTPLDLAIDLGRNDIMFLLLSLRTYNPEGQVTTDVSHDTMSSDHGNGHLNVNGQAGVSAVAPAQRPFDDPGRPQPDMGFLGFADPAPPRPSSPSPAHIKRGRMIKTHHQITPRH